MSSSPASDPVEERLADRLSARQDEAGQAPAPAILALRRLGSYDRAVYRSVAGLSTPLFDAPLRADIRLRQPLQAVAPRRRLSRAPGRATWATWCAHRTRGRRRFVPAREPAHEDRGRTPPARLGCSQGPAPAAGADAIVDVVSIGPLRVRGRVRCCSRGPAARVPAALAGRQHQSWRFRACTQACTTPVTFSSEPPLAPWSDGWRRARGVVWLDEEEIAAAAGRSFGVTDASSLAGDRPMPGVSSPTVPASSSSAAA